MNKKSKVFGIIASVGILMLMTVTCAVGVFAETRKDIIESIVFPSEAVAWPNDVECTVTLKEPCSYLRVYFRQGNTGNRGSFLVEDPYGELVSYSHKISHAKLVNGTYTVYSVVVDESEVQVPENCSFTVTGAPVASELVEGSLEIQSSNGVNKKEVLSGESFTLSISIKDVLPLASAELTMIVVNPDRTREEKVYKTYQEKRDGDVHTLTFTISTDGMKAGTRIVPSSLAVTNEAERLMTMEKMETLGTITVVENYTPTETPTPTSTPIVITTTPTPTSTPVITEKPTNTPTSTVTEKPSQEESDSKNSTGGNESPVTTNPEPAQESIKTKTFSPSTALSPETSASKASNYLVKNVKSDDPYLGTEFGKLKVRQSKAAKTSITIAWDAVAKTEKYIIFGNQCGKKFKKYGVVSASANKRKWTQKKLKAGKYYKFIVMAVDSYGRIISTSTSAIIATTGGTSGNPKSLSTKLKGTVTMSVGSTKSIGAKKKDPAGKTVKSFNIDMRYEWTDPSVITVSKKGVITAKKKGTSTIYIFTQNGKYKTLKVKVQ